MRRDSTRYVFDLRQDGLGLPDRDYYLLNDRHLQAVAPASTGCMSGRCCAWPGMDQAWLHARQIVQLETALAQEQWTQVQNRDPVKTYNKVAIDELSHLTPGYDWQAYLHDAGVAGRTDYVVVGQPSYLSGFSTLWRSRRWRCGKPIFAGTC